MTLMSTIFCDIMPCNIATILSVFGMNAQSTSKRKPAEQQVQLLCLPLSLFALNPSRWMQYIPPKYF